jgi:hypothetical protein
MEKPNNMRLGNTFFITSMYLVEKKRKRKLHVLKKPNYFPLIYHLVLRPPRLGDDLIE